MRLERFKRSNPLRSMKQPYRMNEIEFSQLAIGIQDVLKYIAAAAMGGVIGNRTDAWFMSLFFHQRRNLTKWLVDWNPTIGDIQALSENEDIRSLLSKVIHDISNEVNDQKLLLWSMVTDSILRNTTLPLDKKQFYTSLYNRFDIFTIKYLATLYYKGYLKYNDVFEPLASQTPGMDTEKQMYWLGQLQCAVTGLTKVEHERSDLMLTELGKEFVNFISHNSMEKIEGIISKSTL